jgi:hypothetical protein
VPLGVFGAQRGLEDTVDRDDDVGVGVSVGVSVPGLAPSSRALSAYAYAYAYAYVICTLFPRDQPGLPVLGYDSSTREITVACGEISNSREHFAADLGKQRALRLVMYDVDAIEAINFDQLVTATDRLLLRGGRLPKGRPSRDRLAALAQPLARGSHPIIKSVEPEQPELTVVMRSRSRGIAAAATLAVSSALVAFAAVISLS